MTNQTIASTYLRVVQERFLSVKKLGEDTITQLSEEELRWSYNEESNNVAVIIKHMSGNMISRWSDFLTSDGEKADRNRDDEFNEASCTKKELLTLWENGWNALMTTLAQLQEKDLTEKVTIRGEEHYVIDAIERQMAHYGYHIGQIVYVGKMVKGIEWQTLSIAKGQSDVYLEEMVRKHGN